MISNGWISVPLCNSINRCLTLVRLSELLRARINELFCTQTLCVLISLKMECGLSASDNLLSPTMKWTRSMLYKQRLTADQRIYQKGVKA